MTNIDYKETKPSAIGPKPIDLISDEDITSAYLKMVARTSPESMDAINLANLHKSQFSKIGSSNDILRVTLNCYEELIKKEQGYNIDMRKSKKLKEIINCIRSLFLILEDDEFNVGKDQMISMIRTLLA